MNQLILEGWIVQIYPLEPQLDSAKISLERKYHNLYFVFVIATIIRFTKYNFSLINRHKLHLVPY